MEIVTNTISYTNHTILPEALEKWPISTFSSLLPRVYQIIDEINRPLQRELRPHLRGLAEPPARHRHPLGRCGPHGQPLGDLQPLRQRRGQDPHRHPRARDAQGLLTRSRPRSSTTRRTASRTAASSPRPTPPTPSSSPRPSAPAGSMTPPSSPSSPPLRTTRSSSSAWASPSAPTSCASQVRQERVRSCDRPRHDL